MRTHSQPSQPSQPRGVRRPTTLYAVLVCLLTAATAGCAAGAGPAARRSPEAAHSPQPGSGTASRQTDTAVDPLAMAVSKAAGPGLDEGFTFGAKRQSGPLRISGPTEFYAACTSGTFTIGSRAVPCDGVAHKVGPFGTAGQDVAIAAETDHWALVVRAAGTP